MLRIKDLREDKEILQKDMAKILNTTQTNYSKYELGKINIPIDTLIKLAKFFNRLFIRTNKRNKTLSTNKKFLEYLKKFDI